MKKQARRMMALMVALVVAAGAMALDAMPNTVSVVSADTLTPTPTPPGPDCASLGCGGG